MASRLDEIERILRDPAYARAVNRVRCALPTPAVAYPATVRGLRVVGSAEPTGSNQYDGATPKNRAGCAGAARKDGTK